MDTEFGKKLRGCFRLLGDLPLPNRERGRASKQLVDLLSRYQREEDVQEEFQQLMKRVRLVSNSYKVWRGARWETAKALFPPGTRVWFNCPGVGPTTATIVRLRIEGRNPRWDLQVHFLIDPGIDLKMGTLTLFPWPRVITADTPCCIRSSIERVYALKTHLKKGDRVQVKQKRPGGEWKSGTYRGVYQGRVHLLMDGRHDILCLDHEEIRNVEIKEGGKGEVRVFIS